MIRLIFSGALCVLSFFPIPRAVLWLIIFGLLSDREATQSTDDKTIAAGDPT
ncbi:MAG: hypothetical protein KDA86_20420 [Planctomycetaceae bacterium]|nr:hypothetical protein [Planctomycetaceae bacterium]